MQHITKGENTERLCLLRVAGEIAVFRQLSVRLFLQNEAFFPFVLEIPEPPGDTGNHGSASIAHHLFQSGE